MIFDYIKIATISPSIKVADVDYNVQNIINSVSECERLGANVIVTPELSITGATCGKLFLTQELLCGALDGLVKITEKSMGKEIILFVGLPIQVDGKIYNAVAGISNGEILGLVPKQNTDGIFSNASDAIFSLDIGKQSVILSNNIIFTAEKNIKIGVEIGSDAFSVIPPSAILSSSGANVIVNPCALPDFDGEFERVKRACQKKGVIYALSNANKGESTTDYVYSGYGFISEDGAILDENLPFEDKICIAEGDLGYINFIRQKQKFGYKLEQPIYANFLVKHNEKIDRVYEKTPFINIGEEKRLLEIQANGLAKRVAHTNASKVVIGLSGGLDSTLAILCAVKAIDILKRDRKDVLAITMPCFGTTSRTLENSIRLAKSLGVSLKKIDITKATVRHLKDIGHDLKTLDATYENAQARERTKVLMDVANMANGLVVGTGDLSELALGWATYNGDHMSMYGVNCSIPKTLVRHLTEYIKDNSRGKVKAVLADILDTPVSPELLPPTDDKINQKTEDIVGPYILHDYFLYNFILRGFSVKKLYFTATNTFKNDFDAPTIKKWLTVFIKRFFSQQFKRSCVPDGVKVTKVSLSPRGEFSIPSDANSALFIKEIEQL